MNAEYIFEAILLILKITIIVLWIIDVYLKYAPDEYQFLDIQKEEFWAARVSFLFEMLIAFLLIYLFNPRNDKIYLIDMETKILLYVYGFILIILSIEKVELLI